MKSMIHGHVKKLIGILIALIVVAVAALGAYTYAFDLNPSTTTGIDIMSVNLMLDDVTKPVIWRGPVIAGTVKQFWTDTIWNNIDYLFVDCPPGTGDVPLTVFQSLPLDGVVIVSSPQDLVSMIVQKAAHMADMMKVPVLDGTSLAEDFVWHE